MINLNLKNKPTTLFIAAPILGASMLMGIGYILYTLISALFMTAKDDSGMVMVAIIPMLPFLLFYIGQIAVFVLIGYLLLRGIYKWSVFSIVVSTIVCPLGFLVLASFALPDFVIDFSTPAGTGALLFIVLAPLAMGSVAYNDIRYRLPRVSSMST